MRFLVDESVSGDVTDYLRGSGHDVLYIAEVAAGSQDEDILARAVEEQRLLITNDKDFGELVFRGGQPHYGVLLFRLKQESAPNQVKALTFLMEQYSEQMVGQFSIVQENSAGKPPACSWRRYLPLYRAIRGTMKLVTFSHLHRTAPDRTDGRDTHVGIYLPGDMPRILNIEAAYDWLAKKGSTNHSAFRIPHSALDLLDGGPDLMARVRDLAMAVCKDEEGLWQSSQSIDDITLLAPIPFPRTIRDFYAFEQHVKTARALRGLDMIPEWYDHPVFYYSNPGCVYGPDENVPFPRGSNEVDFELEIACVIGKPGRDISADEANDYIAGYLILNDWSARDTWRNFESKLSMGPAKSKDFANSLGPYLVTPDELEDRREGTGAETRYNLAMSARVNGKELSRGNANTLTHTFAAMIEWASTDVWLRPGDVLGSGTVGTGCILELRPENTGGWLKPGDTVEMEIDRLGVLRNRLVGQGTHVEVEGK